MKEFQEQYPRVKFVIHQGDYTSIWEWIEMGMIDFGFINPDAAKDMKIQILKNGKC